MKLHKMYSIGQFRNVVDELRSNMAYCGKDDNGNVIYDYEIIYPTLTFSGTPKIHGINAAICYNENDGMWFQSKEVIINEDEDPYGFVKFCKEREQVILKLINYIHVGYNLPKEYNLYIRGEFAGKGIQQGVAISNHDKFFIIFDIEIRKYDMTHHLNCELNNLNEYRIYNINEFKSYEIDIDFNNPSWAIDKLENLVKEVESECPVGKKLGFVNNLTMGEGLVWQSFYNNKWYRFKTKCQKFSVVKNKKKKISIEPEKLESIDEFVEYAVTENRLEQAYGEIIRDDYNNKKIGPFILWIVKDIEKEETDTLKANNLIMKDVSYNISKKSRDWLFKRINNI